MYKSEKTKFIHNPFGEKVAEQSRSKSRAWCKTIVTTSFYIRSYNSFAPSPQNTVRVQKYVMELKSNKVCHLQTGNNYK